MHITAIQTRKNSVQYKQNKGKRGEENAKIPERIRPRQHERKGAYRIRGSAPRRNQRKEVRRTENTIALNK